jgi:hypothetical protein
VLDVLWDSLCKIWFTQKVIKNNKISSNIKARILSDFFWKNWLKSILTYLSKKK